jgi:hypothetical protein
MYGMKQDLSNGLRLTRQIYTLLESYYVTRRSVLRRLLASYSSRLQMSLAIFLPALRSLAVLENVTT